MKKISLIFLFIIICCITVKAQLNSQSKIVTFDPDGNINTPGFVIEKKYPVKFNASESILSNDSIRS